MPLPLSYSLQTLNIRFRRGITFNPILNVENPETNQPIDFFGYSASMAVRPEIDSEEIYYLATTENGRIILELGKIKFNFSYLDTMLFDWDWASYNLELLDNLNHVLIPFKGTIRILPAITYYPTP